MGEVEGDVNSDFIYTFLHGDAASFHALLDAQPHISRTWWKDTPKA